MPQLDGTAVSLRNCQRSRCAASLRRRAPSFSRTWWTWFLTVGSWI
jgi:hypothetical protein